MIVKNPRPARVQEPWNLKSALSFIAFLLIVFAFLGVLSFAVGYPYINGKEEWQEERICTVDSAVKDTSGGGFRMGGSSTSIRIESPDCGKISLSGVLVEQTAEGAVRYLSVEETVSYLEEHRGEQFRFYYGKIQLTEGLLEARRIEKVG
ncbi:hypothetical protein [Rothia nasisuis]|uniref:hypothetical protein n=1 Tax=Rothia nasisuis TaxID=2109647 RepID=UPI001F249B87|nr:hypothetical protein [Rothia nasisuis]